uniref:Kazal-like domain-containing protein n=1 Tax=Wuchereria bancrofti TaxID=6293 RepID=A0A1I8E936_WUCBA
MIRTQFKVSGMLKLIFVCHLIALILTPCFLIQCPARDFIGINLSYNNQRIKGITASLHATCNANCYCSSKWDPVCHKGTGYTFYSACYAGCTDWVRNSSVSDSVCTLQYMQHTVYNHIRFNLCKLKGIYWDNCVCFDELVSYALEVQYKDNHLHEGFCEKECGYAQWLFLILLFFSVVASFATGIPSQQIMLRVVPFEQRTLGFIPGGVLFGMMIDTACLKWKEECGKRQSCLVYDPYRLSWTIMAVAIVCKLVSILGTILGYITYRPNDLDNNISVQTTDSRGPLSLTVNDDRPPNEIIRSFDGGD